MQARRCAVQTSRTAVRVLSLCGIVKILRDTGAPQLHELNVRGLLYRTSGDGPHTFGFDQLRRALLKSSSSKIDAVRQNPGGNVATCNALVNGKLCMRICSAEDLLCDECELYHCPTCLNAALGGHPPCEHLCDMCLHQAENYDGAPLPFHCANARCSAPVVNGLCAVHCCCFCTSCDTVMCEECSFGVNGFEVYADEILCKSCVAEKRGRRRRY